MPAERLLLSIRVTSPAETYDQTCADNHKASAAVLMTSARKVAKVGSGVAVLQTAHHVAVAATLYLSEPLVTMKHGRTLANARQSPQSS